MELKRNGTQPSSKGPDEYFTGSVRIDPLFQAPDPARVLGVSVYVRARRSDSMAQASARADLDRHIRVRVGAKRRWPERGNSARRCSLVPAG
jgi:hypothetical protein